MKIHLMPQGSQEWLDIRRGKITGTDVGEFCLEPMTIDMTVPQIQAVLSSLGLPFTKSALKSALIALLPDNGDAYRKLSKPCRNLLIKKITDSLPKDAWQIEQEDKESKSFEYNIPVQRGNYLEPKAREYYEKLTGTEVKQVGFVESACGTYGCSPDGLVDNWKGVLEIKCPMPETHRRWLLENFVDDTIPADHYWQCEMAMATCEAKSVKFLSYCPGEAHLLVTLERSSVTDKLAEGLRTLRYERMKIEAALQAIRDLQEKEAKL